MPATKSLDKVKAKWQERAIAAATAYTDGVTSPKASWSAQAAASEGNWKAGVDAAAARGAYGKGVREAGDEGWKRAAIEKGSANYATGINFGAAKYGTAMGEVLSTIQGVTLTPRGPRGSAANYQRVQQIGDALHRKFRGR